MSAEPLASRPEGEDRRALLACALLVPAVWLLLGWRPGRLVSGYDAVDALVPMVQALVDSRGDLDALAYRADLLGGTPVRDTLGPQPLVVGFAAVGLSATWVLNLTTFAVQALLAFFAQRSLRDLTATLNGTPPTLAVRAPLAVVFVAFAPFVGWRVGYGHLTLLVGLLPFVAGWTLLIASCRRTAGLTLSLVSMATMAICLPFVGQQLVLYGLVFGLPLAAAAWIVHGGRPRDLMLPLLGGIASLLLAAPGFAPMVSHAFGGDALRQVGRTAVTYSYLTAGPLDWLSSLPWGLFLPPGRPEILHHESNVPLGPLVLLLALLPRRGRPLLVGAGVAFLVAAAFASNLRPISDLLLLIVPPLRSFRVPTRALMPLLAVLPILGLAAVATQRPPSPRPRASEVLAGLAAGFLLAWAPPALREILTWAMVMALLRPSLFGLRNASTLALLVALGASSLCAFRERLLPFPDVEGRLATARAWGASVLRAEPALSQPLGRVAVTTEGKEFGANRAFAAGLSGLDGYGFPQRRFVALVRALRGEPYAPNALLLRFHEAHPASRVLFQLYNVAFRIEDDETGRAPRVERLPSTAGPVWFPGAVAVDADESSLARTLLGWGDATHQRARAELRVLEDDARSAGVARPLAAACAAAEVRSLRALEDGLRLEVATEAVCPVVLATNYEGMLEAWAGSAGSRVSLRTFPAYGALLGVVVPAGTTVITVAPRSWPPRWTWVAAALGLLVAGFVLRGQGAIPPETAA